MGIFGRRREVNEFKRLADEVSNADAGRPWFLGEDEGPDLNVQTGISSNLRGNELNNPLPSGRPPRSQGRPNQPDQNFGHSQRNRRDQRPNRPQGRPYPDEDRYGDTGNR